MQIPLSILRARCDRETAMSLNQTYIDKQPEYQRDYECWNEELKIGLIETVLIGRVMNPIWAIYNDVENTQEILDGMHRIITLLNFYDNKFPINSKYIDSENYKIYDKKYFKDLPSDIQEHIRNYSITFNMLDSSYCEKNKKQRMFKLLNAASVKLNDYELGKPLYKELYIIIIPFKDRFIKFFCKKDKRGQIESEIISYIVLSDNLPTNWGSFNVLVKNFLKNNVGESKEAIEKYIQDNKKNLEERLIFLLKIIERLDQINVFSENKKEVNKYYIIYKVIICRLCHNLKNISTFNRHISDIVKNLKDEILDLPIDKICEKLDCNSRNAQFQQKLVKIVDDIIKKEYDEKDQSNNRLFSKKLKDKKKEEQENKCNICSCDLTNKQCDADHIIPWTNKGRTDETNIQILCSDCHRKK